MASLREIRRKIKSVKSTQQITKAMKMVAASRLRRAQARILSARPFANKMEEMMRHLLFRVEQDKPHRLFVPGAGTKRALLLMTSDKGLCGGFNANLIRQALSYIRQYGIQNTDLFIVGKKGRDYFTRMRAPVSKEYLDIANNVSFAHAEIIAHDLMETFFAGSYAAVDMIYNEFKSVIQQKIVVKQLLPLVPSPSRGEEVTYPDYIFEPGKTAILESIIPRFIKAQLYRVLLESAAAELGARMSAMENATNNASDLIGTLTLTLNRTRQAAITKEILEVVSGAEALK
jgi:F-type H+-transporting ATPase subunit gamma